MNRGKALEFKKTCRISKLAIYCISSNCLNHFLCASRSPEQSDFFESWLAAAFAPGVLFSSYVFSSIVSHEPPYANSAVSNIQYFSQTTMLTNQRIKKSPLKILKDHNDVDDHNYCWRWSSGRPSPRIHDEGFLYSKEYYQEQNWRNFWKWFNCPHSKKGIVWFPHISAILSANSFSISWFSGSAGQLLNAQ